MHPARSVQSMRLSVATALAPGLFGVAGLWALASLLALPAAGQTLAVTGGTVIDGTGAAAVADATVLVRDGRIVAVGAAEDVPVPAGAAVLDARGKYVIPGLIDANLHLFLNIDLETLVKYEGRYHEIVLEAAQIALKSGQTTVFDTWGPRDALATARDMINRGDAPGSRIYLAGNIIGFDGPLSADFREAAAAHVSKAFAGRINETWEQGTGRALLWMPPDSVRAKVREYAGTGVDFLKYGASGHVDMNFVSFSPAQQRAIVEEGRRAGLTVQTHTTSVESFDMAVEAGVDLITHCGITGPTHRLPLEYVRKLVDRGVACSVLPITQRRLDALRKEAPDGTLATYMKVGKENHRALIRAGAVLLVSTDAGIENPVLRAESPTLAADTVDPRVKLGEGHFNALAALEEMGMAPMEILKSATSHVARAYKVNAEIGALEPGKAADMVVLDANPLASALNYRRIHAVIQGGRVVDRDALPVTPRISSMQPPKAESASSNTRPDVEAGTTDGAPESETGAGDAGPETEANEGNTDRAGPAASYRASVSFEVVDADLPPDPGIEAAIAPFRAQMQAEMQEVVGRATGAFVKDDPEGALDNLVADAVLAGARRRSRDTVHAALVNDGGLRVPVAAGPILVRHAYELLPFENYVVVLDLTGEQMERLANEVARTNGEPIAGWTLILEGGTAASALVGGNRIEPDATYRVATVDYLTDGGGTWSVLWEVAPEDREELAVLIRDVFLEYVREQEVVSPKLDGRVRRRGPA